MMKSLHHHHHHHNIGSMLNPPSHFSLDLLSQFETFPSFLYLVFISIVAVLCITL